MGKMKEYLLSHGIRYTCDECGRSGYALSKDKLPIDWVSYPGPLRVETLCWDCA